MALVLTINLSALAPRILAVMLAMLFWLPPAGVAQCKPVDMKTYSLCFPEKWHLDKGATPGRGSACNRATGPCSGSAGTPLPGVILLSFGPAMPDSKGKLPADLSEAITQADPHVSSKESPAELASGALTGQIEYVVSRTLLPNKVWNDIYAIQTASKIFIFSARYVDEPKQLDAYRNSIFAILASVSVRKD